MDNRRRETRLKINSSATLKVLAPMAGPSQGMRIEVHVVNLSGSGIRLHSPLPVPCGAAVEIADAHTRILGETSRCEPQQEGYAIGVRVLEATAASEARQAMPPARS